MKPVRFRARPDRTPSPLAYSAAVREPLLLASPVRVASSVGPWCRQDHRDRRPRARVLSRLCRTDPRGGSSDAIARSTCLGIPSICRTRRSSISKSAISRSATRAPKFGAPSTRWSACAYATIGAGRRRSASHRTQQSGLAKGSIAQRPQNCRRNRAHQTDT